MFSESYSITRFLGCFSCFGFTQKPRRTSRPVGGYRNYLPQSRKLLLDDEDDIGDYEDCSYNGEATSSANGDDVELQCYAKSSEEILKRKEQDGFICRQYPVKETRKLIRSEDENGNKTINEYVKVCKIGSGSYGKVVLYRSCVDDKHYAIKAFHKSYLLKTHVAPSETAMTDVLREVLIMKMLNHPNIVSLIEVIDDPDTDYLYMVLEYVDGKWNSDGSIPSVGIGENMARKYLRDILSGLAYLHEHNIVHGDIKPDNLLVTCTGIVKIGDFSVSQVFENDKDELRRSPGTPAFTAPECCVGLTYHGRAADIWALGVTLYYMVLGHYPFFGESHPDIYDKIVKNPLVLPDNMNPLLRSLLEGILCKDPTKRLTLEAVASHPWVVGEDGPIPQYMCWCKRKSLQGDEHVSNKEDT
ncbi:hypothetical protein SAY86_025935 [Trapa natans]|uniref:non-specific serine/threonine protein kinase n=1 Tax=Trapa natans TaxID=22666 RepID=A0AAN7KKV2_TRANT|nr:hypothetical protein SAY86_025935 [Trapa natans]